MPVAAWIATGACALGVICAVLWLLTRLAAGRAAAQAAADANSAALKTAEKVIDAQSRPDPSDTELDQWLRRKRDGA